MLQRLSDFAFADTRKRWRIYVAVMAFGFLYGVVNDGLLGRPTRNVTLEMAGIMSVSTLAAIVLSTTRRVRRQRQKASGKYAGLLMVVAVSTVAINALDLGKWERRTVDRRLSNAFTEESTDLRQAATLLKSAHDFRLRSDPQVRVKAVSALLRVANRSKDRREEARAVINQLLGYQSVLENGDSVIERVNSEARELGLATPVNGMLLWKATNQGELILSGQDIPKSAPSLSLSSETVPGSLAAIAAPIKSEASKSPQEGAGYIVLGAFPAGEIAGESAHITFSIDGMHLRNVICRRCKIVYRGGPLILENVAFEDCSFDIAISDEGQRLVTQTVGSSTVDFSAM